MKCSNTKQTLLSGVQPSGNLTIGNYLGALRNFAKLQNSYNSFFCVVDLHAITVRQDPKLLLNKTYEVLCLYIASGLDPKKNNLFIQSHVPEHTELSWILNCFSYIGELNRMTQYKEKSKSHNTNINAGLFGYPVLQAADILLYNADLVPIGEDQKQHLELTRNIAERFNNIYGNIFTVPEIFIPKTGARIMSLLEPESKMSKSDINANNYIYILDTPDVIMKKMKKCVTDSNNFVKYDKDNKPGISNLITMHSVITGKPFQQIESDYSDKGYGYLKIDTAELIIETLKPVQEKYYKIIDDKEYLNKIITKGAEAAKKQAQPILAKVKEAIGFIPKQ